MGGRQAAAGIGRGGADAMTSLAQMVQLRLSGMAGSPRQFAASRLAAMLGRADLPSRSELTALRPATRVLILGFAAWIGTGRRDDTKRGDFA